jgi:4-hydroxybenzoate polyprenyltransferase
VTLVVAYLRQRFPLRVFAPVIVALTGIAWWATGATTGGRTVAYAGVVMALLVAFFRVWDDIEDRDHDRLAHPDRILPRGPAPVFWALQLGIGAGVLCVLIATANLAAALGCAGLVGAAYVGYHHARARLPIAMWSFALLLKYPAMVAIVASLSAPVRPGRLVLAALITYTGACAYERRGVTS